MQYKMSDTGVFWQPHTDVTPFLFQGVFIYLASDSMGSILINSAHPTDGFQLSWTTYYGQHMPNHLDDISYSADEVLFLFSRYHKTTAWLALHDAHHF